MRITIRASPPPLRAGNDGDDNGGGLNLTWLWILLSVLLIISLCALLTFRPSPSFEERPRYVRRPFYGSGRSGDAYSKDAGLRDGEGLEGDELAPVDCFHRAVSDNCVAALAGGFGRAWPAL